MDVSSCFLNVSKTRGENERHTHLITHTWRHRCIYWKLKDKPLYKPTLWEKTSAFIMKLEFTHINPFQENVSSKGYKGLVDNPNRHGEAVWRSLPTRRWNGATTTTSTPKYSLATIAYRGGDSHPKTCNTKVWTFGFFYPEWISTSGLLVDNVTVRTWWFCQMFWWFLTFVFF